VVSWSIFPKNGERSAFYKQGLLKSCYPLPVVNIELRLPFFAMKAAAYLLFATMTLVLSACESTEPKRRKAVPPPTDLSGQPWNRPTKAEGAGRFGSMVPQSR
jgi:hypothetical protein